jgi:hypothetical protein
LAAPRSAPVQYENAPIIRTGRYPLATEEVAPETLGRVVGHAGARCEYVSMVWTIEEWPRIFCTIPGCSLAAKASEAKVWRSSWKVRGGSPASFSKGKRPLCQCATIQLPPTPGTRKLQLALFYILL